MAADSIIVAAISAVAVVGASALTILFTKQKEREAIWREKRLSYYEEFFKAASGIVAIAPPDAKIRFAHAVNNLHLVGSGEVIRSLHAFTDAIAESRDAPIDKDEHDRLWSRLVWAIRHDLGTPPARTPEQFSARLWASGVPVGTKPPFELSVFTEWGDEADRAFDRL